MVGAMPAGAVMIMMVVGFMVGDRVHGWSDACRDRDDHDGGGDERKRVVVVSGWEWLYMRVNRNRESALVPSTEKGKREHFEHVRPSFHQRIRLRMRP
jgi:hypothetical protein